MKKSMHPIDVKVTVVSPQLPLACDFGTTYKLEYHLEYDNLSQAATRLVDVVTDTKMDESRKDMAGNGELFSFKKEQEEMAQDTTQLYDYLDAGCETAIRNGFNICNVQIASVWFTFEIVLSKRQPPEELIEKPVQKEVPTISHFSLSYEPSGELSARVVLSDGNVVVTPIGDRDWEDDSDDASLEEDAEKKSEAFLDMLADNISADEVGEFDPKDLASQMEQWLKETHSDSADTTETEVIEPVEDDDEAVREDSVNMTIRATFGELEKEVVCEDVMNITCYGNENIAPFAITKNTVVEQLRSQYYQSKSFEEVSEAMMATRDFAKTLERQSETFFGKIAVELLATGRAELHSGDQKIKLEFETVQVSGIITDEAEN